MTDDIVRMHLVQALTWAIDPDIQAHVRAALELLDVEYPLSSRLPGTTTRDRIERAETELETWLARHATDDIPELVLTGILRDYAELIDDLGYVPRTWASTARNHTHYPPVTERSITRKPTNDTRWRDPE